MSCCLIAAARRLLTPPLLIRLARPGLLRSSSLPQGGRQLPSGIPHGVHRLRGTKLYHGSLPDRPQMRSARLGFWLLFSTNCANVLTCHLWKATRSQLKQATGAESSGARAPPTPLARGTRRHLRRLSAGCSLVNSTVTFTSIEPAPEEETETDEDAKGFCSATVGLSGSTVAAASAGATAP